MTYFESYSTCTVLKDSVDAKSAASHFLAAFAGGMLIARMLERPEYLEVVVVSEMIMRLAML